MSYCLVLDTSTSIGAVALYHNENLISTIALHQPNVHSEKIALIVQDLLAISKVDIENLTHIAIAKGPGSYTGLRIGLAFAKSLSFGLKIPIIGFSTLLGQAAAYFSLASQIQYPVISCLDAGRNEIYLSIYHPDGTLSKEWGATLLPHSELQTFCTNHSTIIIGNGTPKIQQYHPALNSRTIFVSQVDNPLTGLGKFLLQKIQNKDFENLITFEPDYFKPVHITLKKS